MCGGCILLPHILLTELNKGVPKPEILPEIVKLPIKYKQTRLKVGTSFSTSQSVYCIYTICMYIVTLMVYYIHFVKY